MLRTLVGLVMLACLCLGQEKPIDLKLRDLDGQKVQLRDYRGKLVVLNFWATWCGPCREEMPMLVAEQKAWAAKGVVFIAVSLDEKKTMGQVASFVAKYGVGFPVWLGGSLDDLGRFKLGEGVPDTMFLDERGVVVARVLGEVRKSEVEERLEWLVGGKNGVAPAELLNHM